VYALGLLLYRTVTGELPWPAQTASGLVEAHCHQPPADLPDLPTAVAQTYRACLAKRPADRPTSAAVHRTLLAALGDSPGSADVPGLDGIATEQAGEPTALVPATGTPSTMPVRHRRPLVLALAGCALAGTAAALAVAHLPRAGASRAEAAVPPASSCRVAYQIQQDTGSTFQVRVTVANTGARPAQNWALSFDFPGDQRLAPGTGTGASQRGQTVTLRAPGDQPVLSPGRSTTLGLPAATVTRTRCPPRSRSTGSVASRGSTGPSPAPTRGPARAQGRPRGW
jgi:eukaryotic-like serine/threonine-protein kinase